MVFGDKIKKHGSFLLHAGIEFHTIEGLIYLSDAALEGVVLLVAKECRATKLFTEHIYLVHGVLVSGMEGFLFGGLIDVQSLVVVVVKSVKSVCVIQNHIK